MQTIALINQKGRVEKTTSKTINKYYKLFLLIFDTIKWNLFLILNK